ncbi:MAG: ribbon-helix-helix domain-containing protein [Candidatus Thorarchaeota archaeon]
MTKDKPKGKFTTVSIPIPLFNKVRKRIEDTGFTSVSSYVTYILRELIASHNGTETDQPFSKKDEEKVKARLQALGYLE